ncbi:hypothetical protein MHYP_G00056030 [Metynnis hypsauchen]
MRTRGTYFWRFLDQNEDEDPAFYIQPRRLQSTVREVHVEIQCSAVTVNSPQSKTSCSSTTDFIIGRQVEMLLRVVLSPTDIRKLSILTPSSVEELVTILCDKLQVEKGFLIQYEDPDFNYELCNLNDISELPPDKATLRLHWEIVLSAAPSDSDLSDFTLDTASKSSSTHSSTSDSATAFDSEQLFPCTSRSDHWPSQFPIPLFSYDVELRLQKANEDFKKNGMTLNVTRDIKMHILEKLAEAVYSYKAYPKDCELEKVACALVDKHPCLKAPGSNGGWEGWKLSLKFKMANYRQKLRYAGCPEITVNFRQGSSRSSLKRPRKSELNFLPDHPVGFNEEDLEKERALMEEEVKKKDMSLSVLKSKMEVTFSLRRKEIVADQPLVSTVKQRWPGLFIEEQVYAEFQRIDCIDLKSTFLTSLDNHTRGFLKMYRAKANQGRGSDMEVLLEKLDSQTTNLTAHRRCTVLRGLPLYMRERPSISKTLLDTEALEDYTKNMKMGILEVVKESADPSRSLTSVVNVAVVLEEEEKSPLSRGAPRIVVSQVITSKCL